VSAAAKAFQPDSVGCRLSTLRTRSASQATAALGVWASRGDVNLVDDLCAGYLSLPTPHSTLDHLNQIGVYLILPGIRLLDLPLSVALDQIQLARDLPVSGYSFCSGASQRRATKDIHSTQGTKSTSQDPIPYRQPFPPLLPLRCLTTRMGFSFRKQSTVAAGAALSSWRTQAVLKSALNQLSMLLLPVGWQWQKSLAVFQSQFPDWMRRYALESLSVKG